MKETKKSFRHESIQDTQSIKDIFEAICKGLGDGSLSFSDEDGSIVMKPKGLLNLKLTASEEDARRRVDIRISWEEESGANRKKQLKVN
ncbi:amphi-Trp domain-containing protein [Spongiibacter sp. KMU-158]|uniref:Amphi-Trp domain-containing protein n=1 Tax=Spongiibacter pelagi TaxID=2760804 RepID=A0A927C0V0_9GAMM|nr:amphi-Trp domain-containing protein [Spongiibacter pelagi]MBD2857485.1 amphi-Trp domain-containing protein [Spongiibacter pelagi]